MTDLEYWRDHWWPAPAKLNLMLRVLDRRPDGYHNLQTVFQLIAFYDWLNFVPRQDDEIKFISPLQGVDHQGNLVMRAANLLRDHSQSTQGVNIQLRKVLPMGAGMGGGSSDAATTLVVLNALWGLGYSIDQLADLGLKLGADVPVFVRGQSAWAEGLGEQLTPLEIDPSWYLVVTPSRSISTAQVFAFEGLTRHNTPITIRAFQEGARGNDCLPAARAMSDELDSIFQEFSRHAEVHLTGTGSSLFAACDSREAATALSEQLPENWVKLIVKGVNQSPLHDVLKQKPCAA